MKNRVRSSFIPLAIITGLLLLMSFVATPQSFAATTQRSVAQILGNDGCPVHDYDGSSNATIANTANPQLFGYENNSPELGLLFNPCGNQMEFEWSNKGADFYQLITSVNGQWSQTKYNGNLSTDPFTGLALLNLSNYAYNTSYAFKVQGCWNGTFSSNCTDWSPDVSVYTNPQGVCIQGYFWREARPGDQVCVTSDQRNRVAYDNTQAANRINPSGAYGPDTCIQGFVWREAFANDHVCVTPDEYSIVVNDNAQAPNRIA